MKRYGRQALGLSLALGVAQICSAQAPPQVHPVRESYWRSAQWPTQYVQQPRHSICQTFQIMTANGWKRQNLLSVYHFQQGSGALSEAGELKLRWILTQPPVSRRQVYVERGADEQETADRLAAVERRLGSIPHVETTAAVSDTAVVDYGWPAASVDAVFTGYQQNRPAPVLPDAEAGAAAAP